MKGIILAGGLGTRLFPMTKAISKQILPVYDKPMIYYPLSTLMLAGIREIAVISSTDHLDLYKNLLGSGEELGIKIEYIVQKAPNGIAEAFILAEKFIANDPVCLILGDNIFYGLGLASILERCTRDLSGALILGYYVNDPERYGVVEFDEKFKVLNIEEKPKKPKSHYAVTGIYFYDNDVINIAKNLKPSPRGELEITDVNLEYMRRGKINLEVLSRGFAWLDTGTPDSLLDASNFISTIEKRQGLKVACLEEIAYIKGFITFEQVKLLASKYKNSTYGEYILNLLDGKYRY